MSENSAILHFDDIVKSEYEIQLYGFSLNQFAEESKCWNDQKVNWNL